MCNYFSGVACEDGTILWLPENPENHEAIVEKYKLKDDTLKNRSWVRFELQPDMEKLLQVKTWAELKEKLRDIFTHSWDEEKTLPGWIEKNCATIIGDCYKALAESVQIHLIPANESVKELQNRHIHMMWGNSVVNDMRGNSVVNDMRGNSVVKYMQGNSVVNDMQGNSVVNDMRGNSVVKYMQGNSVVKYMQGNSVVNDMRGNSVVNDMRGNSVVKYMQGNSVVNDMQGNSVVNDMRGNSVVNNMWGNSTAQKGCVRYVAKKYPVKKQGRVPK